MAAPRETASLIQWDDAKGYGFLRGSDGRPKLFVHIRDFELLTERPRQGERFSFEAGQDAQGKPRALHVRRPKTSAPAAARTLRAGPSSLWLIPAFAGYYLVCHLLWPLPPGLWGAYMAMSLASFIVYAGDKRAAQRGQWRVAENTLHGLALVCGWPGGLLAQHLLRHKSSKPQFLRRFWAMVVLNVLVFTLAFTPLIAKLRP